MGDITSSYTARFFTFLDMSVIFFKKINTSSSVLFFQTLAFITLSNPSSVFLHVSVPLFHRWNRIAMHNLLLPSFDVNRWNCTERHKLILAAGPRVPLMVLSARKGEGGGSKIKNTFAFSSPLLYDIQFYTDVLSCKTYMTSQVCLTETIYTFSLNFIATA